MVGYVRRNFLVPAPRMESFEALNAHLERSCLGRMDARLRGHDETIGQRMERDLDALLSLPAVPYDAGDKQAGRVSSLSLVRYKTNDYSAPVAYGHRDVLVKGYVNEVVISCGAEVIATASLALTRRTTSSSIPSTTCPGWSRRPPPWTRPRRCRGGTCPRSTGHCAACWSPRMGRRSKREFVQALRLLENFSHQEVHHAVKDALRLGALSFDAVKCLLLCRLEGRPPKLDLDLYPYLPRVTVKTTRATDYLALLSGRAA